MSTLKLLHFLSRRVILVSLLAGCSLFFTECTQSNQDALEIVFAFGPDDGAGTIQPLLDQFNKEHQGEIKVAWNEGSRFSDAFYHELRAEFESGEPKFDVIGADVIWTPSFASNGWVEDITQSFFAAHNPTDYLEAAMGSVSYQFKIWGAPWYTDAGMLYYRKDLLEKSGFEHPPATWKEVISMSKKIQEDMNIEYGYVFQGADYEGGVTNACEFIWNAEGDILLGDLYVASSFDLGPVNPEVIVVNSDASRKGFNEIVNLMKSGIIPPDVTEFREREASQYFREGKAIFMRSWASSYGDLTGEGSQISPEQIGLAPLPTSDRGMIPFSCLGGWNLMISAKSSPEKKAAAWKFIDFMINSEAQKERAMKGGILPTQRSLYKDDAFLEKAVVANFARQVIPACKERPRSPYYMEMSPEISGIYSSLLKGEIQSNAAVETLEAKLGEILKKHN